jgi:hypothetical protein
MKKLIILLLALLPLFCNAQNMIISAIEDTAWLHNSIELHTNFDSLKTYLTTVDATGVRRKYEIDTVLQFSLNKEFSRYREEINQLKYKNNALEKGNVNKRRSINSRKKETRL